MNAEADHEVPAWGKHPVIFITMVVLAVGWLVLPMAMHSYASGADLPYETWWALWALIAVCNIPVFAAFRRAYRRSRGSGTLLLLLALLPPGVALLLGGIAFNCASFAAITGRSSRGCGASNRWLGWGVLLVGTVLLVAAALDVVYPSPTRSKRKTG